MKNIIPILLLVVGAMSFASCSNDDEPVQKVPGNEEWKEPEWQEQTIALTRVEEEMVAAGNEFAFGLFGNITKDVPDENVLLSPFSITELLSMMANGADGETRTEIMDALGFADYSVEALNSFYGNLSDGLRYLDKRCEINIANSLWINEGHSIQQEFAKTLAEQYGAWVEMLPFNAKAVKTINDWCSEQTAGRIDDFVKEIDPEAHMMLLNAFFLNARWLSQFNAENTENKDFFSPAGTRKAEFMCGKKTCSFYLSEEKDYKMLHLNYGAGKGYLMTLILPDEGVGLQEFIAALDASEWQVAVSGKNAEVREVEVELPKFKGSFEYETALKKALQEMGIVSAFDKATADFGNIQPEKELYISSLKQKTVIEVNEEGTVAGAVSGETFVSSSGAEYESAQFIANRPFVYVIWEENSQAILFMGKVMEP